MVEYPGDDNKDATLTKLAHEKVKTAFIESYRAKATEQESIGMILAKHFGWDGIAIMETMAHALEDANFHTEAATVREWINQG